MRSENPLSPINLPTPDPGSPTAVLAEDRSNYTARSNKFVHNRSCIWKELNDLNTSLLLKNTRWRGISVESETVAVLHSHSIQSLLASLLLYSLGCREFPLVGKSTRVISLRSWVRPPTENVGMKWPSVTAVYRFEKEGWRKTNILLYGMQRAHRIYSAQCAADISWDLPRVHHFHVLLFHQYSYPQGGASWN